MLCDRVLSKLFATMAPLDWSAIEGVKADSLSEEQADELFEVLRDVSEFW